jgi:Met-zincin
VIDFPILEMVESLQWNAIARLYHPLLLRRLRDTELKVKSPQDALTLPELFTGLTNTLWSEVLAKPARNITAPRRAIQRDQLDRMVTMLLHPEPGTPEDARSLARAELHRLQTALRQALSPAQATAHPLDAYTRAHLEEADTRITKALAAPLLTQ